MKSKFYVVSATAFLGFTSPVFAQSAGGGADFNKEDRTRTQGISEGMKVQEQVDRGRIEAAERARSEAQARELNKTQDQIMKDATRSNEAHQKGISK